MSAPNAPEQKSSPFKEITQPFVDLVRAPRALWGINLSYALEGMCYFGILSYLAMYFNEYVGMDDIWAGRMVGVLTAGITISMFFFGGVADKKGVRFAILTAFLLLLVGRGIISAAPLIDPSYTLQKTVEQSSASAVMDDATLAAIASTQQALERSGAAQAGGAQTDEAKSPPQTETPKAKVMSNVGSPGLWSSVHLIVMLGILFIVIGYGMYQPAAYAAVRQFTTPKTAAMGFAMLYALMNLGGWLPSFFGFIRQAVGMNGTFWVYTGLTVVGLLATVILLTRSTVERAIATAKAETEAINAQEQETKPIDEDSAKKDDSKVAPSSSGGIIQWFKNHPLADPKFAFFIFCLIPVQTLFAHNWLTLPMYVERAFRGSVISDYFEFAVNLNPLLIFIFVPIVTALTQKNKVYNMMIIGTFVMAAPTFLLALGATPVTLFAYIFIMTIGEAMWQPRFLQYAAEIAPEGRTGAYMGVAQFPWFMTKMIVPIYSGWFLSRYCPAEGEQNTEMMWAIYGSIAITSTVMLVLARGWIGKDFKTKA